MRVHPGQPELRVSLRNSERCGHRGLRCHAEGPRAGISGSADILPGCCHLHGNVLEQVVNRGFYLRAILPGGKPFPARWQQKIPPPPAAGQAAGSGGKRVNAELTGIIGGNGA